MKKKHNLIVGRLGEKIAKDYLRKKGYKIIEQNYKTKYAEIDLIARYKKTLIFVEVRSKVEEHFGSPEETLTREKIGKFTKNCLAYNYHKGYSQAYRIDAICVVFGKNRGLERISHYQDIIF